MKVAHDTRWKILKPELLRTLAGKLVYERGAAYSQGGQVLSWAEAAETITAQVQGTQRYEVRLWFRTGQLQYSCTCLFAAEGAFCKHLVAVGLQGLARSLS